jgi:hypothetical protein
MAALQVAEGKRKPRSWEERGRGMRHGGEAQYWMALHPYSPLIRGADESAMARFLGTTVSARSLEAHALAIPIPALHQNPGQGRLGS